MRRIALLAASLAALAGDTAAKPPPHGGVIAAVVADCHDGDTCTFDLAGAAAHMLGPRIVVRFRGIDAPEWGARAGCPAEHELAERARVRLLALLRGARSVELLGAVPGAFSRYEADVAIDGHDAGALLVREGLARPWPDGAPKPEWCGGDG